jgi:hypothetical protein
MLRRVNLQRELWVVADARVALDPGPEPLPVLGGGADVLQGSQLGSRAEAPHADGPGRVASRLGATAHRASRVSMAGTICSTQSAYWAPLGCSPSCATSDRSDSAPREIG